MKMKKNKETIGKGYTQFLAHNREISSQIINKEIIIQTVCYNTGLSKHKAFMKNLLDLIKNSQLELLSEKQNSKKNSRFHKLINILKNLKEELNTTFKQNLRKKMDIEIGVNKNKSILSKKLFEQESYDNNLNNMDNNNSNNNNKEITNNELIVQINELKLLNFKAENQLECFETKINFLSNIFQNPKSISIYNMKNDPSEVYNLLHDKLISIREKFKITVKANQTLSSELSDTKALIQSLKEEFRLKDKDLKYGYINTSNIISEESQECTKRFGKNAIELNDNNVRNIHGDKMIIIENYEVYKNKLKPVNKDI